MDVGTGFYVEKVGYYHLFVEHSTNSEQSTKDATKFYEAKVEELGTNLRDLEAIVQGKSNNLRVVEDGKSQYTSDRDVANGCLLQYCGRRFSALQVQLLVLLLHHEKKLEGNGSPVR